METSDARGCETVLTLTSSLVLGIAIMGAALTRVNRKWGQMTNFTLTQFWRKEKGEFKDFDSVQQETSDFSCLLFSSGLNSAHSRKWGYLSAVSSQLGSTFVGVEKWPFQKQWGISCRVREPRQSKTSRGRNSIQSVRSGLLTMAGYEPSRGWCKPQGNGIDWATTPLRHLTT